MRLSGAAVAAALAVVTAAAPSYAVQTDTFSLTATDGRTKLLHQPGDGAVHDSIRVANRSDAPIVVHLDVIGATAKADGNYDFGAPGEGLAADVHLATQQVPLAAGASRDVGVDIDRPGSVDAAEYAVITASATGPGGSQTGPVQERLALLVGITRDAPADGGASGGSSDSDTGRWVLIGVAAALAAIGGAEWARRRRGLSSGDAA